ncbi:TVP38/TMEM64 family protein [Lentibacillus cibarius]|uniref:TVP38/TMEM64 family membrane protein n=1 Tax=Lentibacillus cibarius TaxID=2583219 RepID=A0A549YLZ8_9BACI|nr:VTT domain-containing protein [Lentibacillus cibarius]TMN21128.1 TVP38/TMEM64 family protein [Lentibacillus cibarius]TRM12908.1 TVP38/TMEM64 family protein [Lentibacillus cibarius]
MELLGNYILAFIETGGLFAPVLFISFHLLRPLFFLPVVFLCISGGILFGTAAGTLYSVIGITLSSVMFYGLINWMPKTFTKLVRLKQRLLGKKSELTTSQIAILRLVPFIHFHLLSLCLIEISTDFRDYTKTSLLTNIPLAVIYTSVGQWVSRLSPLHILLFLLALLPLIYLLRRKEMIIKWDDFFQFSA